jgi:hypothetical protein
MSRVSSTKSGSRMDQEGPLSARAVRSLWVVSAWLLLASPAATQQSRPAPPRPPAPPPTAARPPSPPITLPFPNLMPPVTGGLTGRVPFTPPSITPRRDLFRVPAGKPFATPAARCVGFNCGTYGYGAYGSYGAYSSGVQDVPPAAPVSSGETPTGLLRLDGTPADGQVFIDGAFVGVLRDIEAQRVLTLPEGIYHLEIRATDREPAAVDVRIAARDTVTYHVALQPARPRVEPPRPPPTAVPQHMYVIPNCYIGNVPPRPSRLPAGCDMKRVQVL